MTRAAHPAEAVRIAHELRGRGMSYPRIAMMIKHRIGVTVGASTVRDWTKYYSRAA